MYILNSITKHRYRGLTNKFHEFWWIYIFSRFYPENHQGDLFVKGNHVIPKQNQCGKTLEDSRRLSTEVEPETLTYGVDRHHMQAVRPLGSTSQPLVAKSVPHYLLGYIYAII